MKIRKSQSGPKPKKAGGSDLDAALKLRLESEPPTAAVRTARPAGQPHQSKDVRSAAPHRAQAQAASADFRSRQENRSTQGRRGTSTSEEHTPTNGRFFYALKVPASITGPLAEAQRKLKSNWRTTTREQMHVTLCYLPSVPLARVAELKALGARLTADLGPMDIKLRGTGYFPNEGSPRVWFVKVEAEGLDELAAALRGGVQALGIETEDMGFKAHITLARRKGPAPRVPPLTFDLGWTAGGATLQRSHLQKTGPVYEQVSTFRFQAGNQPAAPPGIAPETSPHGTDNHIDHSPSSIASPETQEPT